MSEERRKQDSLADFLSDWPLGRDETADESTWHQFRPPVCLYSLHGEGLNGKTSITNNEQRKEKIDGTQEQTGTTDGGCGGAAADGLGCTCI
jgi:hypothetical protein